MSINFNQFKARAYLRYKSIKNKGSRSIFCGAVFVKKTNKWKNLYFQAEGEGVQSILEKARVKQYLIITGYMSSFEKKPEGGEKKGKIVPILNVTEIKIDEDDIPPTTKYGDYPMSPYCN